MNILFVCHRWPFPPKRGGKIRPFNMIQHLTRHGHRVTVASLARTRQEAADGEGLCEHSAEQICEVIGAPAAHARMIARLPTLEPSSFGYFYSGALARRIRARLARGDIEMVIAHCSSAAQYVVAVSGVPKLLDFGDMDSQKWREYSQHRPFPLSAGYWWEAVRLERREKDFARRFDLCTCTTAAERATLESFGSGCATAWFPNGVDSSYFSPQTVNFDATTICFVGRMDYFPNQQGVLWFCREVLPLLRESVPALRLRVVGAEPSPEIVALGRDPSIEVTGSVPDVRPYVRDCALSIAPLAIARGTQNKILESMAMGVPVVSSRIAAVGVDAVPGRDLLVADSAADYRDAVIGVLREPARRRQLAEAGRARVLSHHDWATSMRRLETCLKRAEASHRERAMVGARLAGP